MNYSMLSLFNRRVSGKSLFELKEEHLESYDPFYYHYSKVEQSKVLYYYTSLKLLHLHNCLSLSLHLPSSLFYTFSPSPLYSFLPPLYIPSSPSFLPSLLSLPSTFPPPSPLLYTFLPPSLPPSYIPSSLSPPLYLPSSLLLTSPLHSLLPFFRERKSGGRYRKRAGRIVNQIVRVYPSCSNSCHYHVCLSQLPHPVSLPPSLHPIKGYCSLLVHLSC